MLTLELQCLSLGATVTTQLGIEKDIKMNVGESQNIAGYDFVFNGVKPHTKDNYSGFIGDISVYSGASKSHNLTLKRGITKAGCQ